MVGGYRCFLAGGPFRGYEQYSFPKKYLLPPRNVFTRTHQLFRAYRVVYLHWGLVQFHFVVELWCIGCHVQRQTISFKTLKYNCAFVETKPGKSLKGLLNVLPETADIPIQSITISAEKALLQTRPRHPSTSSVSLWSRGSGEEVKRCPKPSNNVQIGFGPIFWPRNGSCSKAEERTLRQQQQPRSEGQQLQRRRAGMPGFPSGW